MTHILVRGFRETVENGCGQEEQRHGRRDRPRHHGRRLRQEPRRRRLARGRLRHQRRTPREAAERAGVEIAKSAADVAGKVPTILTSLPKPQALIDTVRAIAAAKLPRKVLVEMSTFAISDKEKADAVLRKAGHAMLDVSGQRHRRAGRQRATWCSTPAAMPRSIRKLRPMFEAFGRHVYDAGAFGNGSKMKYVANLLVAINNVASAEAMVLRHEVRARAAGDLRSDQSGAGNSRMFELRAPMMVKGNYKNVTMKIDVWDKDMQVIGDYARKIKVPTPMFDASKPVYSRRRSNGSARRTPPRSAPCWRSRRRSSASADRVIPLASSLRCSVASRLQQ